LAKSVTPLAPVVLALKVMPPLLALVVSDNVPLAVIPPETVIAWSFVNVKLLAELVPEPMVSPAPAPLLLTVTLPVVLAVRFVVLVASVPIAPLPEFRDTVPAVTVPLPLSEMMPEPLALIVTLPIVAEPVATLAFTATPALVPACNVVAVAVIEFDTVIAPPLTAVSVNQNVLPVDAPLIVTGPASLT